MSQQQTAQLCFYWIKLRVRVNASKSQVSVSCFFKQSQIIIFFYNWNCCSIITKHLSCKAEIELKSYVSSGKRISYAWISQDCRYTPLRCSLTHLKCKYFGDDQTTKSSNMSENRSKLTAIENDRANFSSDNYRT